MFDIEKILTDVDSLICVRGSPESVNNLVVS